MKTMLMINDAETGKALIRWASQLSGSHFGQMTFVCCFTGHPITPMKQVTAERVISGAGLLRVVHEMLIASGLKHPNLMELRHPAPVTAILDALEENPADLLVIGVASRKNAAEQADGFAERLFRFAPCQTLLVDSVETDAAEGNRLLVPMGGSMVRPHHHCHHRSPNCWKRSKPVGEIVAVLINQ